MIEKMENMKMKKKIIGIFVCLLLIASAVLPVAGTINQGVKSESKTGFKISSTGEVKDQYQENCGECEFFENYAWQQFVPTISKLTRVEVCVAQWFGGSPDLKLSVENPLGTVLTSKSLPVSAIPVDDCDWVSFDVPDKTLTPGDTYYIVLSYPIGGEYGWCGDWGNPYTQGTSSKDPNWDYCFRTFARTEGKIVWDNGMDYYAGLGAQWDADGQIDIFHADDFGFPWFATEVCDVHWIGGYSTTYGPEEYSWCISFMYDDGTGNAPDSHPLAPSYAGPFCFTWDEIDKVFLEEWFWEMSVDLPYNIEFPECEKFWISIWAEGPYHPDAIWGYHVGPHTSHQLVVGSDYFGYEYWTDSEDVYECPYHMCFQLTTKGSCAKLCCTGSINWEGKIGEEYTGTFTICNCGCDDSYLNWCILSVPDWNPPGNWTFDATSGTLLGPDCVTINITFIAPLISGEYNGSILIQNCHDIYDVCEIPIHCNFPKNKLPIFNFPILNWLFERFPNTFPILRYMLGL